MISFCRVNIVFEVDHGTLYLAVQMPDKTLCDPDCPVTVSVVQNADGATFPPCWLGSGTNILSQG